MNVRNEYPRPQFKRQQWLNLNGSWNFTYDDNDLGIKEKWFIGGKNFSKTIIVPFVYQTEKSGIHDTSTHEIVWYHKKININLMTDKRYILHFGAVDYFADIYLNGQHVGSHKGGNVSFSFDVTYFLNDEDNDLVVRVFDPQGDETILRGKQYWKADSEKIWYTNTTGIWQTVWMEEVAMTYLENIKITPLFDDGKVQLDLSLNQQTSSSEIMFEIKYSEIVVTKGTVKMIDKNSSVAVDLLGQEIFRRNFHGEGWSWTPEQPNLFDLKLTLKVAGRIVDEVESYFGFRKVHQENGMVYLNNKPYYQKLVLDQGYWPESLLTAPSDEALKADISLAKEMGFNGCRKHQKTEDPRFLYWADKLGYLVWGECASAPIYHEYSVNELMREWQEIIARDYNHPCIITWVPLNESWGVPQIQRDRQQQHFSQAIYHYIHSVDSTRLVISNDGWSMTETDICAIHNYSHGNSDEIEKYNFFVKTLSKIENILSYPSTPWPIYADGFAHKDVPIILTEFGGIGYKVGESQGWGYTSVATEKDFIDEYQRILQAVYSSKALWGFCYTQLTDIEQEINGLLTYHRKSKCDLKKIKAINDSYHCATLKLFNYSQIQGEVELY